MLTMYVHKLFHVTDNLKMELLFLLHILIFFSLLVFFGHIFSFNAYLGIIQHNSLNLVYPEYYTGLT